VRCGLSGRLLRARWNVPRDSRFFAGEEGKTPHVIQKLRKNQSHLLIKHGWLFYSFYLRKVFLFQNDFDLKAEWFIEGSWTENQVLRANMRFPFLKWYFSGSINYLAQSMNNNDILKKLRVALSLKNDDILQILELVDFKITKGALGDLFRSEDHPSFVPAQDQILRKFLDGLIIHKRGKKEEPPVEPTAE